MVNHDPWSMKIEGANKPATPSMPDVGAIVFSGLHRDREVPEGLVAADLGRVVGRTFRDGRILDVPREHHNDRRALLMHHLPEVGGGGGQGALGRDVRPAEGGARGGGGGGWWVGGWGS